MCRVCNIAIASNNLYRVLQIVHTILYLDNQFIFPLISAVVCVCVSVRRLVTPISYVIDCDIYRADILYTAYTYTFYVVCTHKRLE